MDRRADTALTQTKQTDYTGLLDPNMPFTLIVDKEDNMLQCILLKAGQSSIRYCVRAAAAAGKKMPNNCFEWVIRLIVGSMIVASILLEQKQLICLQLQPLNDGELLRV